MSSIKTVALDGSKVTTQITIDIVNLKLFALLMCKGKHKTKAEHLFDIILGPEKMHQGEKRVAWRSGRIHKVFKMLIFLSEIFPKKYQTEFLDELSMMDNRYNSIRKPNTRDSTLDKPLNRGSTISVPHSRRTSTIDHEDLEFKKAEKLGPESIKAYQRNKFFWSDTYLIVAEERFDDIFEKIYEDEFIDKIFSGRETLIDKDDFVEAIAGNPLL